MTKEEAEKLCCPYKMSNSSSMSWKCSVDKCMAWKWTETKRAWVGTMGVMDEDKPGHYKIVDQFEEKGVEGKCSLMG